MKRVVKIIIFISLTLCLTFSTSAETYQNYIFTYDGEKVEEPQAYVYKRLIRGENFGIGSFNNPQDVFCATDGSLYVADTDNNRVIKIYNNGAKVVTWSILSDGTSFSSPTGLYIRNEYLFVADSGNQRVVRLNMETNESYSYYKPDIPGEDDLSYIPMKVAVDSAWRLYVVCKGVNTGIIEMNKDGEFLSHFGAIKTTPTAIQIMWRSIMNDTMLESMERIVPTEYSNLTIDDDDFIYGTISALDANEVYSAATSKSNTSNAIPVRKLNPLGNDVLHKSGFYPPVGELNPEKDSKNTPLVSQFIDICLQSSGIYGMLDEVYGRVYVYNSESDLLFDFGTLGNTIGDFGKPSALDCDVDGVYYVADSLYNQIVVFEPTEYAKCIFDAVKAYYDKDYESAENCWQDVLKYSINSDLAYKGMGKSQMRLKEYKKAMYYFKLSHQQSLYSEAYQHYRDQWIGEYFNIIVGTIAGVIVVIVLLRIFNKHKKKSKKENDI